MKESNAERINSTNLNKDGITVSIISEPPNNNN